MAPPASGWGRAAAFRAGSRWSDRRPRLQLNAGIDMTRGEAYTNRRRPNSTSRKDAHGPGDQAFEPHRHRHRVELPRARPQHGGPDAYSDIRLPDSRRRG